MRTMPLPCRAKAALLDILVLYETCRERGKTIFLFEVNDMLMIPVNVVGLIGETTLRTSTYRGADAKECADMRVDDYHGYVIRISRRYSDNEHFSDIAYLHVNPVPHPDVPVDDRREVLSEALIDELGRINLERNWEWPDKELGELILGHATEVILTHSFFYLR